jgi:excisionase family DNA binding protein
MTASDGPDQPQLPELLTTGQAAKLLGVASKTVIRWFDDGQHGLKGGRVGRGPRRLTRTSVLALRAQLHGERNGTALDDRG